MKDGLERNHSILGLHTAGNEGTTDALGFFNNHDHDAQNEFEDIAKQSLFTRIKPNLDQGVVTNENMVRL